MKKELALAVLLLPLMFAGCSRPAPFYPPAPPPPAFSRFAQRGFHDGVEAARRDITRGRPPEFARHGRFRNPPAPPPAFEDYRRGFRSGYEQVFHHGPESGV
ncbi:MAG TPA: hypothetical protein VGR96_16240 [Acidobacteriaceae bacterium]|nr:hypothetical protein [Acidobacteriaceae bacterium]